VLRKASRGDILHVSANVRLRRPDNRQCRGTARQVYDDGGEEERRAVEKPHRRVCGGGKTFSSFDNIGCALRQTSSVNSSEHDGMRGQGDLGNTKDFIGIMYERPPASHWSLVRCSRCGSVRGKTADGKQP
jgi:hypothetical protein